MSGFTLNPMTGELVPASSGGAGGNGFGIIQPPNGTSPTASAPDDTLNVTNSDSNILINGTSSTKTLDFSVTNKLRCIVDPSYGYYFREDFIGYQSNLTTGGWFLMEATANSGVVTPAGGAGQVDNSHPGVAKFGTGSTTNGSAGLFAGTDWCFGAGLFQIEFLINCDVLSNSTDSYKLRIGTGTSYDSTTAPTNGVWFEYTDAVNSGKITMNAAKGGVVTTVNSTAAPTASSWNKFKIVVAADSSLATFYLNGVSIGTISTNIPSAAGQYMHLMFQIMKLAGTNARTFWIDYVEVYQVFTTAR